MSWRSAALRSRPPQPAAYSTQPCEALEPRCASVCLHWRVLCVIMCVHTGIHEEMLKDGVRTRSYMNAIMNNSHQVRQTTLQPHGPGRAVLHSQTVWAHGTQPRTTCTTPQDGARQHDCSRHIHCTTDVSAGGCRAGVVHQRRRAALWQGSHNSVTVCVCVCAQFKGKIVLDIGCGTGILSLFCAKVQHIHTHTLACARTDARMAR